MQVCFCYFFNLFSFADLQMLFYSLSINRVVNYAAVRLDTTLNYILKSKKIMGVMT